VEDEARHIALLKELLSIGRQVYKRPAPDGAKTNSLRAQPARASLATWPSLTVGLLIHVSLW